ncbi:MAG: hypothetical protein HUU54_02525 [Ignavibacteriaceae bacterium]|nr:hypothetical protein [Ignavibacteriaceae bacterium]
MPNSERSQALLEDLSYIESQVITLFDRNIILQKQKKELELKLKSALQDIEMLKLQIEEMRQKQEESEQMKETLFEGVFSSEEKDNLKKKINDLIVTIDSHLTGS